MNRKSKKLIQTVERERDDALRRLKDAEDAYRELDSAVREFEPQIRAAVDQFANVYLKGIGVDPTPSGAMAQLLDFIAKRASEAQAKFYKSGYSKDSCGKRFAELVNDTIATVILDVDVCRPLVESKKLSWDEVRFLVFKLTGQDVGPTVNWDAWGDEFLEPNGAPKTDGPAKKDPRPDAKDIFGRFQGIFDEFFNAGLKPEDIGFDLNPPAVLCDSRLENAIDELVRVLGAGRGACADPASALAEFANAIVSQVWIVGLKKKEPPSCWKQAGAEKTTGAPEEK